MHDAARPLVDVALIDAVAAAAGRAGAAIPVLPVADTIKRMRGRACVRETVDRAELGAAQTPQGFRLALLREAYDVAERDGGPLTDEAMAVERIGRPVRAVAGLRAQPQDHHPDDLAWAEDVLARGPRVGSGASHRHRVRRAPAGARAAPLVLGGVRDAARRADSRATPTATA